MILVLSADPAQMARALEADATGFLSKPFVLAEVVLRVRQMLGGDDVSTHPGTLARAAHRAEVPVQPRSDSFIISVRGLGERLTFWQSLISVDKLIIRWRYRRFG